MPYFICDTCGGYYELQPSESPEDFDSKCECGGHLKYIQDLTNPDKFQKICSNCGSIIDDDKKKCPICGFKDEISLKSIIFFILFWVFSIDLAIGIFFVRLPRYYPNYSFPKDFYSYFILSSIIFVILIGIIIYIRRRITNE